MSVISYHKEIDVIQRGPRSADNLALIRTEALADGELSFKARGILAYLLAQRSNAAFSVEQLARSGADGKRSIESGLRELEEHGYLTRSVTLDGTPLLTATDAPGVEAPTPTGPVRVEVLVHPADAPKRWQPSEYAIQSAKDACEFMDWKLYITTYLVRCKERGTQPDSGEWLRWLLQEEQRLVTEDRRQAKERGERKHWYAVAGD